MKKMQTLAVCPVNIIISSSELILVCSQEPCLAFFFEIVFLKTFKKKNKNRFLLQINFIKAGEKK